MQILQIHNLECSIYVFLAGPLSKIHHHEVPAALSQFFQSKHIAFRTTEQSLELQNYGYQFTISHGSPMYLVLGFVSGHWLLHY